LSVGLSKGYGIRSAHRSGPSDSWSTTTSWGGEDPAYWVKITRNGNVISGFKSADGISWTQISSVTLNLNAAAYIGLMTCSMDNSTLAISTIENISVAP